MTIVAVQLQTVWEDKQANHERVRQLLDAESIEEDSLFILPEMFDTGFSMCLDKTAQNEARDSEQFLRRLAIDKRSTVLAGVVGPVVDGMGTNEAVAFNALGEEVVRYIKRKPFSKAGEDRVHHRGSTCASFNWRGMHVAPFICYDLRFPELFRESVQTGTELMIVIACWPKVRSEHWFRLLQARAIENLAIVVGVNRCGEEPGLEFDGRSCAFDEQGRVLFEADAEEQVKQIQIDPLALRNWRATFPPLRDM